MSDLDINYGGAISVDTDVLRGVGEQLTRVGMLYDDVRESLQRAYRKIIEAPGFSAQVDTIMLWSSGVRAGELGDEAGEMSAATLLMADAYEVVELQAQAEMLEMTDASAADALRLRADRLIAADGRVGGLADRLVNGWEWGRFEGLNSQWSMGGHLPPFFMLGAMLGVHGGLGRKVPGMRLSGTADPVTVTPVKASSPSAPPTTLREAFTRFPSEKGAQVRVDRLTMPDRSVKYIAYIKGTASPPTFGGNEPWDMKSNTELYTGSKSASYQATIEALTLAGAGPGDQVDLFGHSQGGMIAAALAMESEFDVGVIVTAGSPVEPVVRDDQTLIQLAHTDDVVRSLAAGGSPGGSGSPDSFTASRVGDPLDQVGDLALDTHQLDRYAETAGMVDESGDPRAGAIAEYLAELGEAVEVESTEYRAVRE